MRRLSLALLIGAVTMAGAAAHAGSLGSASLSFQLGTLPAANFPAGAGVSGNSTSDLSAGVDAGTAFNGVFTTTLTTMAAPPISKITVKITKNDAGAFAGATKAVVGGSAKFSGASGVFGLGNKLLDVPLALGVADTFSKAAGGVAITAINAPWTAGKAVVTDMGAALATATGSNALDAGGGGTLKLVAPVKVVTNINGITPAFAVLTLNYVPEPALPLMLVAGAATLGIVGVRRRRS